MSSKEIYGKLIKPDFEINAAQAEQDKLRMEKDGFYTPHLYFRNTPEGLWAAQELNRYITKMGYTSSLSLDAVVIKNHGDCQLLQVGKVPYAFLEDIKDFLSMREVQQGNSTSFLFMSDNGHPAHGQETAMSVAFKDIIKRRKGPKHDLT